jgi:hypothetical protein
MWGRRNNQDVAELLYRVLIADSPAGYAREVAERMSVPYSTLSKYWLGKRRFPAALVKPLFFATDQDVRVAEFFLLDGSDYRLERRPDSDRPDDIDRALVRLGKLAGEIADRYLAATSVDSDGGDAITAREAAQLRAACRDLVAHTEALRHAFDD